MTQKTIWILAAHGSRIEAANQEVRELASELSRLTSRVISAAFLEIAEPNIPTAIDQAASKNPQEICVLPYFLTQGRHVQEDIPAIIEIKNRELAPMQIKLLPYLGKTADWVEVLRKIIR